MNILINEAFLWSKAAYGSSKKYNINCFSCVHTDCQVTVVDQPDKYVIAFRGSDSIQDWIINSRVQRVDFMNGKVHKGFLEQYYSVRRDILQNMKQRKNLLICGHSLGGALACICAADLVSSHNVTCICFGAPCVGDKAFRKIFLSKVNTAVNICSSFDPVTWMPLRLKQVAPVKYVSGPWGNPHGLDYYEKSIKKCNL